MRKSSNGTVSEVLKVRHYVMNLLYHSHGREVQIPSVTELADRFGIARSTVQLALKALTDEGYIVARSGIGNFVNPRRSFTYPGVKECAPVIGFKMFTGDQLFYGGSHWNILAEVGFAVTRCGGMIRLLDRGATTPETIAGEIEQSCVDGLILYGVRKGIAEIARKLIPTVHILDLYADAFNSISFSREAACRELVGKIGVSPHTLFLHRSEAAVDSMSTGLRRAGFDFSRTVFLNYNDPDYLEKFEQVLAAGIPEVIFHYDRDATRSQLLQYGEKHGIDVRRHCRFICSEPINDGFRGFNMKAPEAEAFRLAVDEVLRMIRGKSLTAPNHVLDYQLIEYPSP